MVFRRLDAELTLNSADYIASLRVASAETRTFSAEAMAAGKEAETGFESAAAGAKSYSAAVAESARANIDARLRESASIAALRAEYQAIADSAVKGSAEQVAASQLVEEANKKLIASGLEVEATNSGVGEGLRAAIGVVESLGLKVQSSSGIMGTALKGLTGDASAMSVGVGVGVAAVGVAIGAMTVEGVRHFEELGNEVRSFQRLAGTSAEDSSKLVYAFRQLGIEPQQAAAAIGIFSRNLVDHGAKVEAYGVQIAHLKNGNVDTIGSLYNLADAFQKVGPGAEGTALALDLMGRGGKALIPVLQRGRDGLKEFFDEAQRHGLVFSQEDLNNAKEFTLAGRDASAAFQGLEIQLGKGLVPALAEVASGMALIIDKANELASVHGGGGLGGLIKDIVEGIVPAAAGLDLLAQKTAGHTKVTQEQYLAMQMARDELADYGDMMDPAASKLSDLTKAEQQLLQTIARHGDTMVSTASEVGISADQMAQALGYQGKVGVDAFKAEEEAAKDYASAVQDAQSKASAAYMKSADVVSNLSATSLASDAKRTASSMKAADSQVNDDTRVADAVQHVADLQQQYADKAESDRQAYADKVASADQAMADADQNYADTVQSTNDKIAQADQKLADDRISLAQSVADAQQRLSDDQLSGQDAIAQAEQRLADTKARQAVQNDPAASKALNDQIALRDAQAAVDKAKNDAAKKEQSDLDAIGKAQQNQIKTLEADQDAADKARVDGAKAVEKAEDAVTKAREAQNKLAAEANTIGVETIQQQREMQRAVEAVTQAQQSLSTAAITETANTASAVELTVADVKKFYDDSATQADKFQADIRTAISMGYDPGLISRLLQEGATEAEPLLGVLVSQSDKSFVDMVNNAEAKMRDYDFQIREMARLTQMAASSTTDQMNNDLSNAMSIMEANAGEGGRKTSEVLATQLGLGVDDVQRIATEFGITLADGINPVLAGVGADQIVIHAVPSSSGNPTGKFLMAMGGQVPGVGDGDTVPAMLTPGEFVVRKDVVAALGPDYFRKLNAQHFATGGFVTGSDVPRPPDFSAYGDKVGYAGSKVTEGEYNKVVDYINSRFSKTGATGATSHGQVADWVAAGVALAHHDASWVTPEVNIAMFESGGDPNAINEWDSNAAAGTPSIGLMQVIQPTFEHYKVAQHDDIRNPVDNVAAATNYIAANYGNPWNTPGERSLARGGPYLGYELGGLVEALTTMHVGVMDRGGWLEPGWNLNYNGLGVREPVGAMAMTGGSGHGGGDIIVNVTVQGPALGTTGKQIAATLAEPLRAEFARRGQSSPGNYLSRNG